MPLPSLKEQQAQLRKTYILDAAQEILREQGFVDMNMDDLASHVGTSKATLYKHFASKDDLVLNVVIRVMEQVEHLIGTLETLDPPSPAADKIKSIIMQGLERQAWLATARLSALPSSVREDSRFQKHQRRLKALLTALVDTAKEEGDVAKEHPTRLIVQLIISFFDPAFHAFGEEGRSPAASGDALTNILFKGIEVRS